MGSCGSKLSYFVSVAGTNQVSLTTFQKFLLFYSQIGPLQPHIKVERTRMTFKPKQSSDCQNESKSKNGHSRECRQVKSLEYSQETNLSP